MKIAIASAEHDQKSKRYLAARVLTYLLLPMLFVSLLSLNTPIAHGVQVMTTVQAEQPSSVTHGTTKLTAAPSHQVTWDRYSLFIDGKRLTIWAGEFDYWRLPSSALWRDVLEKMKAAGFNAVTIYFVGYHSPKPGVYDFTGIRNINELLTMTEQVGLYVIARRTLYQCQDGCRWISWLADYAERTCTLQRSRLYSRLS